MVVIDEEERIEDELEILPPFLLNKADSFHCFLGEFGPEKNRIQGGSFHRSCIRECYLSNKSDPEEPWEEHNNNRGTQVEHLEQVGVATTIFYALRAPPSTLDSWGQRRAVKNGVVYNRKIYDYNYKESPPSITVTRKPIGLRESWVRGLVVQGEDASPPVHPTSANGNLVEVDAGKGCSKLADGNMEYRHKQVALIKCLKPKIQSGEGVDTVISELAVENQYGKDTGAFSPSADSIELDSSNPSTNQTCPCKSNSKGKWVVFMPRLSCHWKGRWGEGLCIDEGFFVGSAIFAILSSKETFNSGPAFYGVRYIVNDNVEVNESELLGVSVEMPVLCTYWGIQSFCSEDVIRAFAAAAGCRMRYAHTRLLPLEIIEHLRKGIGSKGQIVHVEVVDSRKPIYVQIPNVLSDNMKSSSKCLGITKLYSHQAESILTFLSGKNVVVATMTSSGKSLCYNVPLLEALSHDLSSCALSLFPTKFGVDVGHIDVTLHLGFPGSAASLWQQAGRSGRRERPSLAVYVAFQGSLDQYFMKFPKKLFPALEHPLSLLHAEKYLASSSLSNGLMTLKNKGDLSFDPSLDSSSTIWSYIGHEAAKYHVIMNVHNIAIVTMSFSYPVDPSPPQRTSASATRLMGHRITRGVTQKEVSQTVDEVLRIKDILYNSQDENIEACFFEFSRFGIHQAWHFLGLFIVILVLPKDTPSVNLLDECMNKPCAQYEYAAVVCFPTYFDFGKMPSRGISIRAMESIRYRVIEMQWNEVLEEIEKSKAFFQIYEGVVCIHQGKTYMVKELDISEKTALCYEASLYYYTKTRDYTDIELAKSACFCYAAGS
uniref:DEAD/DEAH-box helicase domain-containing protein n=1 Tax=Salix viminalis TaxID=40686 RepID=A0A6N2N7Z0_SALVM